MRSFLSVRLWAFHLRNTYPLASTLPTRLFTTPSISDFNLSWIPKIRTFPCPSSPEAEGKLLLDEGTAIALREAPFASSAKLVANGEGRTG